MSSTQRGRPRVGASGDAADGDVASGAKRLSLQAEQGTDGYREWGEIMLIS